MLGAKVDKKTPAASTKDNGRKRRKGGEMEGARVLSILSSEAR